MRKLMSMNYQNKYMYDSCKTKSPFNTVDEQLIVTDSDCNGHLESDLTNLKENKHAVI